MQTKPLPSRAHIAAVSKAALQSYLPDGWTIHWLPNKDKMRALGEPELHQLYIPHPTSTDNLFILLHELGHIVAKDGGQGAPMGIFQNLSPPHAECTASHWAKAYMLQHQLAVSDYIWGIAKTQWQGEEHHNGVPITES